MINIVKWAVYMSILLGALSTATASPSSQRACPKGYVYAGEDTPIKGKIQVSERGFEFYEEIFRSDVYSCYKFIDTKEDKEILGDLSYFDALKGCLDENDVDNKARLVSFDDGFDEVRRFVRAFASKFNNETHSEMVLTSAVKFPGSLDFIWSSTNSPYNISSNYIEILNNGNVSNVCLGLEVKDERNFSFMAVPCQTTNIPFYVCETRVQMVTFVLWIWNNSLNLLLFFSIIMLLVVIGISGCAYKTGRVPPPGRSNVTQQTPRTRVSGVQIDDSPPSYETYVNAQCVHDGLPPKYDDNGQVIGKMEQLKNKGKDILATVTLFKSRH